MTCDHMVAGRVVVTYLSPCPMIVQEMSRREATDFLSFRKLHFGRVHVDTRESATGGGMVKIEIHQASLIGRSVSVCLSFARSIHALCVCVCVCVCVCARARARVFVCVLSPVSPYGDVD